jgi:small-conductance mechanosensitive channel
MVFWKSRLISVLLLLLAFSVGVGLFLTRDTGAPVATLTQKRAPIVDEKPLQAARSLLPLADSRDEQRFAQQALTLADHEVDLAFTYEMRYAKEHPATLTDETKEMYARVSRAEAQVKDDQDLIDQLKKSSTARGAKAEEVQQQIELIQAQLELDQDELENAQQNLRRSGVDRLSRVQRQFTRYQAAQQGLSQATTLPLRGNTTPTAYNLFAQVRDWRNLRWKIGQLQGAKDQAMQNADALQKEREQLQSPRSSSPAESDTGQKSTSGDSSLSVIDSLRRLSANQKDLSDLAKRMQDHAELATVCENWTALARNQQRSALHRILLSAFWIILIVLATHLASRAISHFMPEGLSEHTRLRTLRLILRFSVQAIGVLLVLFVLFGIPSQTSTIIGLATAGLTIALKDFIVAFVGWFVLIGRNGVRVGDWVEINGVMGEVVEITLLRTVILETGNWTDIGHPTGRKVTFMNSYAIEGHFFNFSTAGQWLWDEIELVVPADRDPYPVLDAIQKLVASETASNVQTAEQEWKSATSRYTARTISAAPAINLRPTGSSVEVHVRYITRANERFAMRTRLYQALVDLLHRKTA